MSLCLKFLYTNYSYSNSCSFLLSSLTGQISGPRAWRSQHGHEYRRIAASVKPRNLAFRMKFIPLPTNTTVLSTPHPLPSPQFRLLHLQFWLWSPGGIALHFLHIFLFPLNGRYIVLKQKWKVSSKSIGKKQVQCDLNLLWKIQMCIERLKGRMCSFYPASH